MALKEMFEDERGGLSYTRIASMISLINGIATSWYGWINGKSAAEIITLISIFMVAAFAPKVIQKFAEIKGANPILNVTGNASVSNITEEDLTNSHTATPTITSNSDTAK